MRRQRRGCGQARGKVEETIPAERQGRGAKARGAEEGAGHRRRQRRRGQRARHLAEDADAGREVERRREQAQAAHARRVQRGEDRGEQPAERVCEQHRPVDARRVERRADQSIAVLGEAEGFCGPLPVEEEHRRTGGEEVSHRAACGREVPDVRSLDGRRDDDHRRTRLRTSAVASQARPGGAENRFVGRLARPKTEAVERHSLHAASMVEPLEEGPAREVVGHHGRSVANQTARARLHRGIDSTPTPARALDRRSTCRPH